MASLEVELQKIHESKIDVSFAWTWDGDIDVAIGNDCVGLHREGIVRTVGEIVPWLQNAIAKHYPESKYNVERQGGTWKPNWYETDDFAVERALIRKALEEMRNQHGS
jgi:hypothetical protein